MVELVQAPPAEWSDADLDRLAAVLAIRAAVPDDWRLDALYRRLLDDGCPLDTAMRRVAVFERLGWGLEQAEIAVTMGCSLRTVEGDVAALRALGGFLRDLIVGSSTEELMAA